MAHHIQSPPKSKGTDGSSVETKSAPWMAVALEEFDKGVRANVPWADIKDNRIIIPDLSRKRPGPTNVVKLYGMPESFVKGYRQQAMEETKTLNPEIEKYLQTVTIDPKYDPKGRERGKPMSTAMESKKGFTVTPWCAAFVNYCLGRVGIHTLGFATADSWLRYGVPLASAVYGCVSIVSGHVAFLFDRQGEKIVLLGGNQSAAVSKSNYTTKDVLGYRWPS